MKKFLSNIKLPVFLTTMSGTAKLAIGLVAGICVVAGGAFAAAKAIPTKQSSEIVSQETAVSTPENAAPSPVATNVTKTNTKKSTGNVVIAEVEKPSYTAPTYIPTFSNSANESSSEIPDYMPSASKKGEGTVVDTTSKKTTSSKKTSSASSTSSTASPAPASKQTGAVGSKTSTGTSSNAATGSTVQHTHNYVKEVTKKPTCKDKGLNTYRCTCGETYTEEVEKLEHSWSKWTVSQEATCRDKGVEKRTCSNCQEEEKRDIDKLAHEFDEWTVVTAPTCSKEGVEQRVCKKCGGKEQRPIAKVAHTWGSVTVLTPSTCSEEGVGEHTCLVCNAKETTVVEKQPHTWGRWIVEKANTCTEDGKRHHVCDVCGYAEAETTKATGHTWGAWNTTDPDCTHDGFRTRECATCGETQTETLKKFGHSASSPIRENETPATCEADGSYDSVIICTECGDEISRTTVTIPKLGHYYVNGECIRCHAQEAQ